MKELGYVLLEECVVLVRSSSSSSHHRHHHHTNDDAITSSSPTWHDVDLRRRPRGRDDDDFDRDDANEDDGLELTLSPPPSPPPMQKSSRMPLATTMTTNTKCDGGGDDDDEVEDEYVGPPREEERDSPSSPASHGRWNLAFDVVPFDGRVRHMSTTTNENGTTREGDGSGSGRRSDASLMAGLCIEIDRHADMRSLAIRRSRNRHRDVDGDISDYGDGDGDGRRQRRHRRSEGDDYEQGRRDEVRLMDLRTGRVRIMFHNRDDDDDGEREMATTTTDGNSPRRDERFVRTRASMIFTFVLSTTAAVHGENDDEDEKIDIVGLLEGDDGERPPHSDDGTGSKRRSKTRRRTGKYDDDDGENATTFGKMSLGHRLIGSIVRSDWKYLDERIEVLEDRAMGRHSVLVADEIGDEGANATADSAVVDRHDDDVNGGGSARNRRHCERRHPTAIKLSFFPNSLDVEELYDRISGASKHLGNDEFRRPILDGKSMVSHPMLSASSSALSSVKPIEIADLPDDIIATSIAPYLRARSLHSLRVANRKFHASLRAVVPGLRLKLVHHQIRSLEWMEMRERRCLTEGDILRRDDHRRADAAAASGHRPDGIGNCDVGESACGGDYHRAVTGGATVVLRPRLDDGNNGGHVAGGYRELRFDSETGHLVSSDFEAKKNTRCARGGLLCDDPGLGKTITVMSLILRSFGLSTEARVNTTQGVDHDELFYSYWNSSFLTAIDRRTAVLELTSRLINSDKQSKWFVLPIDPILDEAPDYLEVISNPISLQEIRNKYKSDCIDFRAFETDVELCFLNGMTYNPPQHAVYEAAERLRKSFSAFVSEFKLHSVERAAKSISRMVKDPSATSLVNSFQLKKNAELAESLLPSSSTLLVVPNPLIHHWKEQILRHIDFGYISTTTNRSKSTLIYYHTSKRNVTDANISFDLKSITDPIIFIDDGSKALPPPYMLARFRVVLTSYNRFTSEWRHGNVEQEIRASKKRSGGGDNYFGEDVPKASSLLKVYWLRVIIDEGHVLGKSSNNLFQFASWLPAERLWGMTGTPTQQIATQNASSIMRNLFHISNFLKHEFFSQRLGREHAWNALISTGWRSGDLSSFFRLKHLVSYLMVRHTKADLIDIPPPIYGRQLIELSNEETATYNTIVAAIRTNIITTGMKGRTSGWQDSLLNPRQSKYASEALTNLRVACCGGAQVLPQITSKHWAETLEICRGIHNLDDVQVQVVNNFIYRAQTGELSGCHNCGLQLQTLFVIPCGHLICSECIDNETKSCPACKKPFDVDDFQRLQPGLNNQFCLNLQEEKIQREQQYALKRALSDPSPPRRLSDGDVVARIEVNAPAASHARSHKRGESCIYSPDLQDGKCTVCREEHYDCNFMNSKNQCFTCFKCAEECPDYNRKSKYVIGKLLVLRESINDGTNRFSFSPTAARLFAASRKIKCTNRPLKVIIFSQFRTIYEYFGDHLIRRFGGACVADYSYGGTRAQELQKFINSPECFVMLLSKQGAVGLDLSFVTHIFFLDQIFDKSLESQVVARAYRMGALGPVFVEQLTAKNSIEEVMDELNEANQAAKTRSDDTTDSNEKHTKLHKLLKSAKFIRPPQELKRKKRKVIEPSADAAGAISEQQHVDFIRSKKSAQVRFQD